MPVSLATYERLALEDDETWEWWHGRPIQKPGGTYARNSIMNELMFKIGRRFGREEYEFRINSGRLIGSGCYFVPDGMVIPREYTLEFRGREVLEAYDRAMPFVLEVWCESQCGYDVDSKLRAYRERGDKEIWLVEPFQRWVTRWIRTADGSYTDSRLASGTVGLDALPDVNIDLNKLFRLID